MGFFAGGTAVFDKSVLTGKVGPLDIGSTTGALVVSGDLTSASATAPTGSTSLISVVIPARLADNYIVHVEIEANGDRTLANDVTPTVLENFTTTGFDIFFEETGAVDQDLILHVTVIADEPSASPGEADPLEYLRLAEIAADATTNIQSITGTTNDDWDAVAGDAQRLDLSTPTENDSEGDISVGSLDVTIGKAGRYEIIATLNGIWDAGNNHWCQLVQNGATVLDVAQFSAFADGSDGSPAVLVWQGDLAVSDTLDVRVDHGDAETSDVQAYSISIKQLPTVNGGSTGPQGPTGPAGGGAKSWAHVRMGSTQSSNFTAGNHVEFDTIGSQSANADISISTGAGQLDGLVTIPVDKVFKVQCQLGMLFGSAASSIRLQIRDNTNGVLLGEFVSLEPFTLAGDVHSPMVCEAFVPADVTEIEARIVLLTGSVTQIQQSGIRGTQMTIEEL